MIVQWLDTAFPSWVMGVFIIGGGALATWLAVRMRHRWAKHAAPRKITIDNDLTEVFVLVVVTMYAILVAFIIFTVWTNYDRAEQAASAEAGLITALARQSIAFPQPDQRQFQLALRAYTESVMHDEWPTMAHGQSSPVTTQVFNHLFVAAQTLPALSDRGEISTELDDLSQAREALLLGSGAALPNIFWFILLVGAVLAIALSVVFFTETPRAHGLMAVAAAVIICTSIWLIMELDYPLSGDTAFSPDSFERALYVISTIQNGQV